MKIKHHSLTDTEEVCKHYSKRDKVSVKYVCTTELEINNVLIDIFYRSTPHPEFGNHYFGLFLKFDLIDDLDKTPPQVFILNADSVENFTFGMVQDLKGWWHYSACRHDYNKISETLFIDGGRSYVTTSAPATLWKVKKGIFMLAS